MAVLSGKAGASSLVGYTFVCFQTMYKIVIQNHNAGACDLLKPSTRHLHHRFISIPASWVQQHFVTTEDCLWTRMRRNQSKSLPAQRKRKYSSWLFDVMCNITITLKGISLHHSGEHPSSLSKVFIFRIILYYHGWYFENLWEVLPPLRRRAGGYHNVIKHRSCWYASLGKATEVSTYWGR